MWNPTKTNFTSYKASLSNSTFISKFRIPGAVSNFSVTNLTAGGIYNFTLRRLQGNIEGASAFIEIVTGLYGFFFSLLVNDSCQYQCTFSFVYITFFNNMGISREAACNMLLWSWTHIIYNLCNMCQVMHYQKQYTLSVMHVF